MLKRYRIFMILMVLAVVATGALVFNRVATEMNNRQVDFVLDYYEVEKLAEQSDEDMSWWLEKFESLGVSSVGINYETIRSISEDREGVFYDLVLNIKKDRDWKEIYPEALVDYIASDNSSEYDMVVTLERGDTYDFISENLKEKYGDKVREFDGGEEAYLLLEGSSAEALYSQTRYLVDEKGKRIKLEDEVVDSKLADLHIGLDGEKVSIIESAGLEVLPRIANNIDGWNGKSYIKGAIDDYLSIDNLSAYLVFGGSEVIGYSEKDKSLEDIKKLIESRGLELGIIETDVQRGHIEQEGIDDLIEYLDYEVLKVFSIAPYIQERYEYYNYDGSEEIENTIYRAVTERNVKLTYFRPFKSDEREYVTDEAEYDRMFTSLEDRLQKHGISYGRAVPMKSNRVSPVLGLVSVLGTLIAGIILLNSFVKLNSKTIAVFLGLGMVSLVGSIMVLGEMGYMLLAIATAVIWPSLSMVYLLESLKKYYCKGKGSLRQNKLYGARVLLITSMISLLGAFIVAGIMSDSKNLLDINYFQGVKLSQLIPIAIYVISFIGYFGYKKEKSMENNRPKLSDFREVMIDNMKIFYALIIALLAGVGYVYLARTGHESGIQPSNLEMVFRNIMENILLARPRTKEMLIAFPAVIVAAYMASKRLKLGVFVMGLLAIIGQTSIVNTFTHFKTPIYVSLARTIYGLIIGVLLGAVYTIVVHLMVKLWERIKGEA